MSHLGGCSAGLADLGQRQQDSERPRHPPSRAVEQVEQTAGTPNSLAAAQTAARSPGGGERRSSGSGRCQPGTRMPGCGRQCRAGDTAGGELVCRSNGHLGASGPRTGSRCAMARISSAKRDLVDAHIRSTRPRVTALPLSGCLRRQPRSVVSSITSRRTSRSPTPMSSSPMTSRRSNRRVGSFHRTSAAAVAGSTAPRRMLFCSDDRAIHLSKAKGVAGWSKAIFRYRLSSLFRNLAECKIAACVATSNRRSEFRPSRVGDV